MEHAQDSTESATGATVDTAVADSTPLGQDAETVSKTRFDGLMASMGARTRERDEARQELERLRELVAAGEDAEPEPEEGEVEALLAASEPDQAEPDVVVAVEPVQQRPEGQWAPARDPRTHIESNAAPRRPPVGGSGTAVPISLLREGFAKMARVEHQRLVNQIEQSN